MSYIGLNGNFDLMKKLNMEKVFKIILLNHPISRAKIAGLANLNKVTVSSCVDFLLEKEIIYEIGTTKPSRGRPPTLINLNENAGVFLAFDIDAQFYRILITDFRCKKLEYEVLPLPSPNPETFLQFITQIIHQVKEKYKQYKHGLMGVGIAAPGLYNSQTGMIQYASNLPEWVNYPLSKQLQTMNQGTRFFIEKTANLGAIGEVHLGKSSTSSHLVYISGNWGLGVGICNEGKLYSGFSGFAGRLGHSTIHLNGKKCTCGNKGCWEAYSSVRALYEQLNLVTNAGNHKFSEIIERLHHHDSEVISAIHDLGYYLGIGLVNVIQAYNPNEVCIGGNLGMLGLPLINQAKHTLEGLLPSHYLNNLNIYCSDLGDLGVGYGAVSMIRDNLLHILIES